VESSRINQISDRLPNGPNQACHPHSRIHGLDGPTVRCMVLLQVPSQRWFSAELICHVSVRVCSGTTHATQRAVLIKESKLPWSRMQTNSPITLPMMRTGACPEQPAVCSP